jgi:uncharacterized protein
MGTPSGRRTTDGRTRDVWLPMADGVRLAATLYLPATDEPQPCLLEALPYRKDDLTSSYQSEYLRLRDEFSYAVCRLDLRGTGSSEGVATDEYPAAEQRDLGDVIAWLAAQPWCTGAVGMFGTSYSGFNAIQVAAQRPPALKAICAIYATDDRYTDDVHYMGGTLRLLDTVDYCHYMTPMNALPPVPAVFGEGWREAWLRRVDQHEPWLLTWLAQQTDGPYWRHGSLRPGYDRIDAAVMIVAGWADGYRNNSLRTVAALQDAGTPVRLLLGPWAHVNTASSRPGPRIDLVPEMARWWDRWLRGKDNGIDMEPATVYFARRSTRPSPTLDTFGGEWRALDRPTAAVRSRAFSINARPPYQVAPDVGTAAWISCAGHLPYGQPGDQRHDDADSLTWDWPADGLDLFGHPRVRARVVSSAPTAHLAVRLCDVWPDGTSALITRGLLNLLRRDGLDRSDPLVEGEEYDIEVELEATSWIFEPEHRLRLAIAGADWPNTVAPPQPVTVEVRGGTLELPALETRTDASLTSRVPAFEPGGAAENVDNSVVWRVERDVVRGETACVVGSGSTYDTPYGKATERYQGRVTVDRASFEQRAEADVTFALEWPEAAVSVRSTLDLRVRPRSYDVVIDLEVKENGEILGTRHWARTFDRT